MLPEDIKEDKITGLEKSIFKVYKIYQLKLLDLNACDFGDLILYCVKLFENHSDIKKSIIIILNIF